MSPLTSLTCNPKCTFAMLWPRLRSVRCARPSQSHSIASKIPLGFFILMACNSTLLICILSKYQLAMQWSWLVLEAHLQTPSILRCICPSLALKMTQRSLRSLSYTCTTTSTHLLCPNTTRICGVSLTFRVGGASAKRCLSTGAGWHDSTSSYSGFVHCGQLFPQALNFSQGSHSNLIFQSQAAVPKVATAVLGTGDDARLTKHRRMEPVGERNENGDCHYY